MSNDKYDMISSLPDEMLQHILSFLGIRQAVQTSVLSKRWVNVWTSLSNLNFDPHEFVLADEYRLSTEERKRALDAKLKKFVETLLSRHKTSFLDTFRIKILDQDGCSDLVGTYYCLLGYAVNSVMISHPFHVEFMCKSLGTTEMSNTFPFMRNVLCYFDFGDNIGGLSDVITLELHIKEMKYILEAAIPKLGEFHNLKDFSLGTSCMICNFGPVALFLERTPNLQKITLYMCASRHCRGKKLVSIHIMVKYLMWTKLSRCKNLKRVDIKLLKDFIIAHEIDEALLSSRKQIENTEIIISEHI
ncbi:F-box/FBD/LRR-repeat protein At5g18770-like [Carex rostrata]